MWKRISIAIISLSAIIVVANKVTSTISNSELPLYASTTKNYMLKAGDSFTYGDKDWIFLYEDGMGNGVASTKDSVANLPWNSLCFNDNSCRAKPWGSYVDAFQGGEVGQFIENTFIPEFILNSNLESTKPKDSLQHKLWKLNHTLLSSDKTLSNPYIYLPSKTTSGTHIGVDILKNAIGEYITANNDWWIMDVGSDVGGIELDRNAYCLKASSSYNPLSPYTDHFTKGIYDVRVFMYFKVPTYEFEIEYEALYGSGSASATTYEYDSNVHANDQVGILHRKNGKEPITYEVIAGDSTNESYKNFELSSTRSNAVTDDIYIKIKPSAIGMNSKTNSLQAGVYDYCINASDAEGNNAKVCNSLTVEKKAATLSFKNIDQKNMIVGEDTFSDLVETNNKDDIVTDDVSYKLIGGISDVLSVENDATNPLAFRLSVASTHIGTGLPTSFSLDASLKETRNYKATNTSIGKNILVYKKLNDLTWSPNKGSYATTDVTLGATVGDLKAVDGVGPFLYELVKPTDSEHYDAVKGADNASFSVSNTLTKDKVDVKTSVALSAKTYYIQFKVTDTDGVSVYKDTTIRVDSKSQAPLEFKDKLSGSSITSLGQKIKFNDTDAKLYAEGGSTTQSIVYAYAPSDMQPSGVNPASYVSINVSNGLLTPIRTGTIKVQAVRPGDNTYADATTYMDLTIEPAEQGIEFNNKESIVNVETGKEKLLDAKGIVKATNASGIGSIVYSSSDEATASVDKATGKLTAIKAGTITLTATMNDSKEAGYNSNYDTVSTTKTVKIYKGIDITFTPVSPNLKAEDNAINDKVGTLAISHNVGAITYAISSNSGIENADASFFLIVGSGASGDLKLKKKITALEQASHGGTFKVQVDITDSGSGTKTQDIEIQIDEAENELSFTQDASKITSLSKQYGEEKNSFQLTSSSSNSGSVTYSVDTSDTTGTLHVTGTGTVTVNKVGVGKVKAVVSSGGGYAGGTITMDVTVTPGNQNIAFKDVTIIKRQFLAGSVFNESAELKETSKNTVSTRVITYLSNTPTVCSIASNGDVTMLTKGICDISALNSDSDWSSTTTNKQINLYDKMSVIYTASKPLLKAESNAIGDKAGEIHVTDHQSKPIYKISTASVSQNADASFFTIIDNGVSADLQLAKKITALDCLNHKGVFKVQVDVSDVNGTETINVEVDIEEADNAVSFTDKGINISSLTKQYGENENTFNLTTTSSNAGSVTYSVNESDTSSTLSVTGTGATKINKVGTGTVKAVIASSGGYAGGTITMDVTITKGTQSIAFKDTATLNRKFILNDSFTELAELKETSKNNTSSRIITYTSNDESVCTIDAVGNVTMLSKGICDITASNSDSNWTSVTNNKKINLYDGMGVSFAQNGNPQAETISTKAGAKAGDLSVSGGIDPKTYAVSTSVEPKNKDASLFQINSSGVVSFKKAIMATDLVGKYNSTKKVYELYVQLETVDSVNTKVVTDAIVEIIGAPLNAEIDTKGTGKISEEYGLGKTFTLNLSSNLGGGTPTYQLKNDPSMPNDVLQSVDASGLVTIRHANDKSFVGNPLMVEAVIPASNGYAEETVEAEVEITKAPQPAFAFKTPNIKLGHGASITPAFTGNLSSGTISLTSGNNALAIINGSDIKAKTTDGKVVITAIESGDRDYKSATATANVTVSSAPAYNFVISVPAATYGDTGLKAKIVLNESNGVNQIQTWSSSDPSIADIDASGNLTIKKAGSVTISCKQTSTGEPSVTATAELVVDPKPITVTIDNASKYVGAAMPSFHAVIPTADLVGSDTLGQPTFSCKDGSALVNADTKAGKYDINATYPTGSQPNYAITVKKGTLTVKQDASKPTWFHLEGATSKTKLDGTKWVNEDVNVVLDSASESAGTYDEISLNKSSWGTIQNINKEGNITSDVFFRNKTTKIIATPQSTAVKIDKTKPVIKSMTGTKVNENDTAKFINSVSFGAFFKPGVEVEVVAEDSNVDKTITTSGIASISYTAYVKKDNAFEEFEKGNATLKGNTGKMVLENPGEYRVCAIAKDNAGNISGEYCSDLNVKKIDIDIDKDGKPDFNDPDGDGCPDINIVLKDKEEKFYKLNVDRDGDKLPDLNIDSDGDGKADINVDTDNDGKPDLNLLIITKEMWKPTFCVTGQSDEYCTVKDLKPLVNVDLDDDNVPDVDIDTNGDYKPDFNITTDGKTPSINIGIIHNWKPDKDGKLDAFVFDTMEIEKDKILTNIDTDKDGLPDVNIDFDSDGKPDINVDTDGDFIPNINVDSDGDGKADVNVDTNKDGVPDENIVEIKEWKPEKDCESNGLKYDTMSGLSGKDQLEDNDFIVTKPGGVFLPNFALKVNEVTNDVSEVVKNDITNKANGQVIDSVFDVKLTQDGVTVQPDGKLQVRIPLPNNLKDPHLVIQQADGTYLRITPEIKDGYLIYETDYLGKVAIVKDHDEITEEPNNKVDTKDPTPNTGGTVEQPKTSVKGTYYSGANTGDTSNILIYMFSGLIALGCMTFLRIYINKDNN